jgi:hypothetical protein
MFLKRIAKAWVQRMMTKTPRASAPQIGPERGEAAPDGDFYKEPQTEAYIPANSGSRADSSLHISC